MRLYHYVGSKRIAERAGPEPGGVPVLTPADVRAWATTTGQRPATGVVIATFVVDECGVLLVADRHSEHVACAGRRPVLSAGEITFDFGVALEVTAVSNQSTGYCPEPESWPAVAGALAAAGLTAPAGFTPACVFRRCVACDQLALVKGGDFECVACGAELPAGYNAQA